MSSVACPPADIADIGSIRDYTAENRGIRQADRYTDDIHGTCGDLATRMKCGSFSASHSVRNVGGMPTKSFRIRMVLLIGRSPQPLTAKLA